MTVRAYGIVLTEIDTPLFLPSNERHVAGQGETLEDALENIKQSYDVRRLDLNRAYYARSDGRYWFILASRGKNG